MESTTQGTARGPRARLQTRSWLALVRAYQQCTRLYAQMLARFGLTVAQFELLSAVKDLDGAATPKAVAERLLVTRGNVTGLMQRLQHKGLLGARASEHDGRSYLCVLTPAGTRLLNRARAAAAQFIDAQLAPFSDEELMHNEAQMIRMQQHLATLDPDAIAARCDGAPSAQGPR